MIEFCLKQLKVYMNFSPENVTNQLEIITSATFISTLNTTKNEVMRRKTTIPLEILNIQIWLSFVNKKISSYKFEPMVYSLYSCTTTCCARVTAK